MKASDRASVLAAFLIMGGAGLVFYFMPTLMLWLGDRSPFLAAGVGALAVLAFFVVFWLRARYQKRRDDQA